MRHTFLRRTAVAAACALIVTALPASAAAGSDSTKHLSKDGSVPEKWDLPTPVIPSDDSAPEAAGGDGDGVNAMRFTAFDDGDMICVFPGTTFTGHTGIWKDALYTSPTSRCVWSANTTPVNGVQREAASKYNGYDIAYGLWVPAKATFGRAVVDWCAAQAGEPYDITSSKTDYAKWYCSKLAWAGWKVKTNVDLDADGGYWVKPADLVNDPDTKTFAYGD